MPGPESQEEYFCGERTGSVRGQSGSTAFHQAGEPTPLPSGWRWARLGELCEDHTEIRDPRRDPAASFRYIDISSVDNNLKRITTTQSILGADAPSRARQVVRCGDVILATTRPNLNAVALVPPDLDGQVCSTGFCVLRPGLELDSGYLFAYVQTREFVDALTKLVQGALYPAVTDRQVRAQPIPLPPLPEQKRIVAIVNEQMKAVERARGAAEAQIEAAKGLPAAYLRQVFDSPEAKAWPRRTIGELFHLKLGKLLSPAAKSDVRPRPYLRNANVQWDSFDLSDVAVMDFAEREEQKYSLRPGDLLVCEGGEPGRAAVWDGRIAPCFFQKALIRLRPRSPAVEARFVMFRLWLGATRGEFTGSHAKTTIAHLPGIRLRKLEVEVPPVELQRQVVAHLDARLVAARGLTELAERQLREVEGLPGSLLRKAFRGEL